MEIVGLILVYNVLQFPVSPAVSTGDTSDAAAAAAAVSQVNDKRRQMQNQLILIMHAHKCNQLSQANGVSKPPLCHVPECAQLRTTLKHMTECEDKKTCKGYYAKQICPF